MNIKIIAAVLCMLLPVLTACGSSSSGHNRHSTGSSMPESGYYIQTATYINDIEVPEEELVPQYIWIDENSQQIHYKIYDHQSGHYTHHEERYSDHNNGNHKNTHHGTSHSGCYNITPDSFEYEDTDEAGNIIIYHFIRISQEMYENQII